MLNLLLALLLIFQDSPIEITFPKAGEIVRGQVGITGNMNATGFVSAELAFAYASDPTSTWFTIQTYSTPTGDSALATWDTTALTDGDYTLRLRVNRQDGSVEEVLVTDIKVRNDVPTATVTITPTLEEATPQAPPPATLPPDTPVPAPVLRTFPTPTPLPANPARLTTPSVYSNFARGTAATLVLFFFVGLILRLRRT